MIKCKFNLKKSIYTLEWYENNKSQLSWYNRDCLFIND
jgi:hypothetical protein